ncbi:hypothetical protein SFA35_25620 (plasmid) [Pseudomonas sp. HR96]|uniref:hypothetical protein n=1 Tax=Pseudomonas sp. HR96 TaxID=1027966 RepID=UPI002A75AA72|nr:hypothetical protein [Pseudomonas sp. HR96]WPP02375.1 hypothetical protein SFA35_25620 [Pseudomonas sp. HR96]
MTIHKHRAKALALLPILLSGCGDDSNKMHCPEKGDDFFQASVADYFRRHPPKTGMGSVHIAKGSQYDDHTNWWWVPIDVGPDKYTALLSCDGKLELEGRLNQGSR